MDSLAQKQLLITEARTYQDITRLLRGWYTFRIYVRFKKPRLINGKYQLVTHRLGFEQSASYSQLFNGHETELLLNKAVGYENCIEMAERTFHGEYKYATIYMRSVLPNGDFDVVCRRYNDKSQCTLKDDPDITPAHNLTLYHSVFGDHLYVHTQPGMSYDAILAEVAAIGPELHKTSLANRYNRMPVRK